LTHLYAQMLLSEMCVNGCIKHPNILPLRGFFSAQSRDPPIGIVTDYLANGNVRQYLWTNPETAPTDEALGKAVSSSSCASNISRIHMLSRSERL
jgi:hypothetical protein